MLNRNEKENEAEDHKERNRNKRKDNLKKRDFLSEEKTLHFTVTRTTHGMSPCDIRRASPPRKTL